MKTRADPYKQRIELFKDVEHSNWKNWHWHQQNTVKQVKHLRQFFPNTRQDQLERLDCWEKSGLRWQLTPYLASLITLDSNGAPLDSDPIWRQFVPAFSPPPITHPDEYSPKDDNWEIGNEMISPIAHHKYDNRVIIYSADLCLAYCSYCLRSLQSNAAVEKHGGMHSNWEKTLAAIQQRPQVEEVILSGGDPLSFNNATIGKILADLRKIPSVRAIRIHTRAWVHNPYRIDEGFCKLLAEYDVTEMAVHVCHPVEVTADLVAAVDRVRNSGARTMLLAQIPLVKDVNDDEVILRELFMKLYTAGIKPYYLLHNMPNIPAAHAQRTRVKRGVEIMNAIGRRLSHAACPEYIIVHRTGKRTVPMETEGTSTFKYERNLQGHNIIRFINWKGEWCDYLDSQ